MVDSPNVVLVVLLGVLAVVACIDLLFDRWLRTRPVFALTFFAVVAFAALNLLLPLIAGLRPRLAAPLALRIAPKNAGARMRLIAAAVVMLVVAVGLPSLIPPVPLRLQRATFAAGIDPGSLVLADTLPDPATSGQVSAALVVLAEVFAPSALPANVRLEWWRDGELLRVSREVGITAHAESFRVWDAWRPDSGSVLPTQRINKCAISTWHPPHVRICGGTGRLTARAYPTSNTNDP